MLACHGLAIGPVSDKGITFCREDICLQILFFNRAAIGQGGSRFTRCFFFNRAAIGRGGSRFTRCLFFFVSDVTRPKLPLGQTLHHATYDVYLPKAVETLVHRHAMFLDTVFFIVCKIYFLLV